MCNKKWILYDNQQWPAQWLDWEEAPKHFPKPNLHQKKVMVVGGLLSIWSTTAFWIPVKPLHLRSMLNKSMRGTENCNSCRRHWSTELAQFSSMTTTDCARTTKPSKVEPIGLRSFTSSAIFTCPLTNRPPLVQASRQLLARKKASTTSKRQKILSKSLSNPEAWVFSHYRTQQNLFLVGKNVLIVMVPILMNKEFWAYL